MLLRFPVLVLSAVALGVLSLTQAAPAQAQAERTRIPFIGLTFNACTGEVIAIEGFGQVVENHNGLHVLIQAQGVSNTGRRYVVQHTGKLNEDGSFTSRLWFISQGSVGDDNHLVTFTYSPGPPPTVTVTSECRG